MHVSSCLECVSEKVVKCALAAMHLIKNVEWRKEGVFLHMLFRSYLLLPLVFFFSECVFADTRSPNSQYRKVPVDYPTRE